MIECFFNFSFRIIFNGPCLVLVIFIVRKTKRISCYKIKFIPYKKETGDCQLNFILKILKFGLQQNEMIIQKFL